MLTRYLICFGWEGFGDRLQSLSYCINLARSRNRVLFVDWSDRMWSGGFHEFFDLVDLPYTTVRPEGPTDPSIFEHLRVPVDDWIYDLKEYRIDDSSHRISVYPGVGFRAYNYYLLSLHLRFNKQTAEEVQREMQRLVPTEMKLVHLRGTDRAWKAEDIHKFAKQHGNVGLISDDQKAVDEYLKVSPAVSLCAAETDSTPLHKGKVTREKIIRMLTDFCLLSRFGAGALNDQSLFYHVAKMVDVKRWLETAGDEKNHGEFCIRNC